MTHYTTISTLKKILERHTIRFNRLDKVDDISERKIFINSEIAKYSFVSCWTNSQNENIALWNMYSKKMKGVCIKLNAYPFIFHVDDYGLTDMRSLIAVSKKNQDRIYRCLPQNSSKIHDLKQYSFEYIFVRNGEIHQNNFLNKMQYEKDFFLNNIDPFYSLSFDGKAPYEMKYNPIIAIKKHKDWSFQKEMRYRIQMNLTGTFFGWGDRQVASKDDYINKSKEIEFEYIDENISEAYFNEMKIIWGPLAKDVEKEEIIEYIKDNKLKVKYSNSIWTNKIVQNKK